MDIGSMCRCNPITWYDYVSLVEGNTPPIEGRNDYFDVPDLTARSNGIATIPPTAVLEPYQIVYANLEGNQWEYEPREGFGSPAPGRYSVALLTSRAGVDRTPTRSCGLSRSSRLPMDGTGSSAASTRKV